MGGMSDVRLQLLAKELETEQQAKVFSNGEGPGVARHWNALVRQLERTDTDYKN